MTILDDRPTTGGVPEHGIDVLPRERWDPDQVADIAKFRDQLARYRSGGRTCSGSSA